MRKQKDNSIFRKLILLFLIIILPIVLIGTIALTVSNSRLKKATLKAMHQSTQSFVKSLDSDFVSIHEASASITTHSKVRKLSYLTKILNKYEKSQAILQVRENISSIKRNNNLINNIRIYIAPLLQAFNADGYSKGSYQTFDNKEYKELISLKADHNSPLLYYNNHLIMLLFSSIQDPVNIVEVDLSIPKLKNLFAKQSTFGDALYLFQLSDGDLQLDNMNDEILSQKILNADFKEGYAKIYYKSTSYYAFYSKFSYLDAAYIQVIPNNLLLQPINLSVTFTILFFIFTFIFIAIYFIGAFKLIHKPLVKLINAFHSVEQGDFSVRIHEPEKSDFNYLYTGYNKMADNLYVLIDQVYNQKILLQRAELKQLQAQINPHFLYNSFFMLQRMMKRGLLEDSIEVSKDLGSYFKYITRNASDVVILSDEYEHAQIYSNIQALRFEGRITIQFGELPAQFKQLEVPRLILQPILENAFNYGLENKISDGHLNVEFVPKKEGIEIIIEDNGGELTDENLTNIRLSLEQTIAPSDSQEITAMYNIYKRIQIFYKNDSKLSVLRSDLGGMKVLIFLSQGGNI